MTGFDTIVSLKKSIWWQNKSIWGVTNVDIEARVRVHGLKNDFIHHFNSILIHSIIYKSVCFGFGSTNIST